MSSHAAPCPICSNSSKRTEAVEINQPIKFVCEFCGRFFITDEAISVIASSKKVDKLFVPKCSYYVNQLQKGREWPVLVSDIVHFVAHGFTLPRPNEVGHNLIELIGDNTTPGRPYQDMKAENCVNRVGAIDSDGLVFIINGLHQKGLITTPSFGSSGHVHNIQLTMDGWDFYEELKTGKDEKKSTAFMAMPFDKELTPPLWPVYEQFKNALEARTDFHLSIVQNRTGLIDDHIRVDIRNARFIIADLTHCNRGAYWEAGYAEGLGKKVIYTCEKNYFESKERGTHFDTNHCKTVLWNSIDNLETAIDELIDIVCFEFPDAKVE